MIKIQQCHCKHTCCFIYYSHLPFLPTGCNGYWSVKCHAVTGLISRRCLIKYRPVYKLQLLNTIYSLFREPTYFVNNHMFHYYTPNLQFTIYINKHFYEKNAYYFHITVCGKLSYYMLLTMIEHPCTKTVSNHRTTHLLTLTVCFCNSLQNLSDTSVSTFSSIAIRTKDNRLSKSNCNLVKCNSFTYRHVPSYSVTPFPIHKDNMYVLSALPH